MSEPLLEVDQIGLRFGGVMAIDDVSFSVAPGELFAIIGPNGAGTTSIFNTISKVDRPQRGDIRWTGQPIMGIEQAAPRWPSTRRAGRVAGRGRRRRRLTRRAV